MKEAETDEKTSESEIEALDDTSLLALLDDPELDAALVGEAQRLLRPEEVVVTIRTFQELDTLGRQALTPGQVFAAMQGIKPTVTRAQVDKLIAEFDENGDGEIQLDEFLVMMGRIFETVSGGADEVVDLAKPRKAGTATTFTAENLLGSLKLMRQASSTTILGRSVEDADQHAGAPRKRQMIYVNVGGLEESKSVMAALAKSSLEVRGFFEFDDARRNRPAATKAASVAVDARSPDARPSTPQDAGAQKPCFSTEPCEADEAKLIWNSTTRVELPSPPPARIRIELFAMAPLSRLELGQQPKHLEVLWQPMLVAETRIPITDDLLTGRDLKLVTMTRLPLPELLRSEHYQREQSSRKLSVPGPVENSLVLEDSAGADSTKTPPRKHRSSFNMPGSMSRTSMIHRLHKRNSVDDDKGPSLATLLHAAVPKELRLGVMVTKDPKSVAAIEAMWETRRVSASNANIRLMERPWYIVSPTSPRMGQWSMLIFVCMIFVSLVTPYEVSVLRHDPEPGGALWVLNYLVDGVFCIDMGLQFFLGYFDKELNQIVNDPRHIQWRYATSWFPLDFVSIFPFAEIAKGNPGLRKLRVIRVVRLIKLAKLTRVMRMGDALAIRSAYLMLIKFSVLLFYLLHWVACFWCLLAQLEEDSEDVDNPRSWIEARDHIDGSQSAISWRVERYGAASRYLHGLEFAIFAMVLTYGEVRPVTFTEHLISIFIVIFMGCLYAYAIGTICGIVSSLDPAGTEFRNNKDLVKTWAYEIRMSDNLRLALLEYLDECQLLIRQNYYQNLLHLLSPTLRGRVCEHTVRLERSACHPMRDWRVLRSLSHLRSTVCGSARFRSSRARTRKKG